MPSSADIMDKSLYTSAEEDMIASFQKLVLNTSGNLRCIEAYQSIINTELDRLSNESKSSSTSSEQSKDCILAPNSDKPEDLVVEFPNFVDKLFFDSSGLQNDLRECFNGLHWNRALPLHLTYTGSTLV